MTFSSSVVLPGAAAAFFTSRLMAPFCLRQVRVLSDVNRLEFDTPLAKELKSLAATSGVLGKGAVYLAEPFNRMLGSDNVAVRSVFLRPYRCISGRLDCLAPCALRR
jgi:hypothetical protein